MRIGGIDQTPLNQNCHHLSDSGFAVANLFGDSGDLCWLVASASLLQCPFHRSHTSGWCFWLHVKKLSFERFGQRAYHRSCAPGDVGCASVISIGSVLVCDLLWSSRFFRFSAFCFAGLQV